MVSRGLNLSKIGCPPWREHAPLQQTVSSVGKRRRNVLFLQIGIHPENFGRRMTRCHETRDGSHGDTEAANAGLASHDQWISGDSRMHGCTLYQQKCGSKRLGRTTPFCPSRDSIRHPSHFFATVGPCGLTRPPPPKTLDERSFAWINTTQRQ